MNLPNAPIPSKGFFVTHFLTVQDLEKSRAFYSDLLGGKIVTSGIPSIIKLSNSWIIISTGGGPTPDKPEVFLEAPQDLNKVNGFLNLRVANIAECYKDWKERGAEFITEPLDNHGWETRCYIRDPDGYIIEVGQSTQKMINFLEGNGN